RNPKVFLFDEPLSNLDAKLRVQMRSELKKLHHNLNATIIYVTHDQIEAMTMADKIVIMRSGLIQQIGGPHEIYNEPANVFVAGFIGTPPMNFVNATIIKKDSYLHIREKAGGFELRIPKEIAPKIEAWIEKDVIFGIRPEDLYDKLFAVGEKDVGNVVVADVDVTEPLGNQTILHLKVGETVIVAGVNPQTTAKEGEKIDIVIDMTKMHLFDPTTEKAII
ncbi:MAG TPA: TOBE domain-containing protein, partial [Thermotogota bacterium]|nr:TOBE domain-containing protein [Thermotogota bacterium]